MKLRFGLAVVLMGLVALAVFMASLVLSSSNQESALASSRALVKEGEVAPAFSLEAAEGRTVSLGEYVGKKNVLLFFSMAADCEPCLKQIVDLEKDSQLEALDVQLVNVGIDSTAALYYEAGRLDLRSPLLSDPDRRVTRSYGVPLTWGAGEPGHAFVLVDKGGTVRWVKDYAVMGHNSVMYVKPDELYVEIRAHLAPLTRAASP